MSRIIDCDQHVYETVDMWREHADPKDRHLALTMEADDLGYWWIVSNEIERRVYQASITIPGDNHAALRDPLIHRERGEVSDTNFPRDLPLEYWDSAARGSRPSIGSASTRRS